MRRALWLLMVAFLCGVAHLSAATWPQSAAAQGGSVVQFAVSVYATLPAGSVLTCKAQIVPLSGEWAEASRPAVLAAAEGTGKSSLRSYSTLCAAEIPLAWLGPRAPAGLAVRYEINARNARDAPPIVLTRGVQPLNGLGQEPRGAVMNLSF